MRKAIYLIFFFTTLIINSQESDIQILQKTITILNNIESIFYTSKFEANESKVTYVNHEDEIFFDFTENLQNSTPNYYIKNKDSELIYNGKHHIQSSVKEKLIVTGGARNPNNPLLLTLFPIRELLPLLIDNKMVEIKRGDDTLLNGENNYVFEFSLKNSVIDWEILQINTFQTSNSGYNKYTLIINKSDLIPRKIVMPNGPSGTLSRTIENLNFNHQVDDSVWTGDLLPKEYTKITFDDYLKQMQTKMLSEAKENTTKKEKSKIEDWKIPNLENDELVDFSKFKGKVVLLEFWFKFCGPCVKAVPELNELTEKHKNDEFLLYGVEFRENFSKENLQEYVSKIKINYPVLYNGKKLAKKYSIGAAPTFMIIDKKGNIIYLESGFYKEKIEAIIKDNL